MDPAARAKYLNGPDTVLFDKGHVLYGLAEARRLLHAGGEDAPLVVVEGYMDVIACQRAGLRQRLRQAARAIADPDLAAAYRDALMARCDALFPAASSAPGVRQSRAGGRWKTPYVEAPTFPTERGRAAAKRLAVGIEPVAAALARQVIADPGLLDDNLEALETHGFGDPALAPLAREIVRLRLEADGLDSEALHRHLATSGFSALLIDIDRAATHAGAPFPKSDVTLAAARSQWSYAFEAMCRLAALDEALTAAKQGLAGESSGVGTLMDLKAQRDRLRRDVKTGAIWNPSSTD
jgi:DNA primase